MTSNSIIFVSVVLAINKCVTVYALLLGLGRLCENPIVDSIGQNNRPMR